MISFVSEYAYFTTGRGFAFFKNYTMSYFVIAREGAAPKRSKKEAISLGPGGAALCGALPGFPVALIKSELPDIDGAFLCVKKKKNIEHTSQQAKEAAERTYLRAKRARLAREALGDKNTSTLQAAVSGGAIIHDEDPLPLAGGKRRRDLDASYPRPPLPEEDDPDEEEEGEIHVQLPIKSWFEQVPKIDPSDPFGDDEPIRIVQYVAASAGAGKTVYSAALAKRYHIMWPDKPIWGCCKTKMLNDRAWKGVPIVQKHVSEFLEAPPGAMSNDLELTFGNDGCLLIVDDWDSYTGKEKEMVQQLITDVINLGRKMRISIIVTSHQINNYHETRDIIAESDFITLFPEATMPGHLYYMCVKKLGIDPEVYNRLIKKGRWVTIHKKAPMYVLSERECEMLVLREVQK